jgi:hypothetical protein
MFAQHDDINEYRTADTPDEPSHIQILPEPHTNPTTVSAGLIPRERLYHLPRGPLQCGMLRGGRPSRACRFSETSSTSVTMASVGASDTAPWWTSRRQCPAYAAADDAPCTPNRIGLRHCADEIADVLGHRRRPGLPRWLSRHHLMPMRKVFQAERFRGPKQRGDRCQQRRENRCHDG